MSTVLTLLDDNEMAVDGKVAVVDLFEGLLCGLQNVALDLEDLLSLSDWPDVGVFSYNGADVFFSGTGDDAIFTAVADGVSEEVDIESCYVAILKASDLSKFDGQTGAVELTASGIVKRDGAGNVCGAITIITEEDPFDEFDEDEFDEEWD